MKPVVTLLAVACHLSALRLFVLVGSTFYLRTVLRMHPLFGSFVSSSSAMLTISIFSMQLASVRRSTMNRCRKIGKRANYNSHYIALHYILTQLYCLILKLEYLTRDYNHYNHFLFFFRHCKHRSRRHTAGHCRQLLDSLLAILVEELKFPFTCEFW
jgi:hypothetical protein